MSENVESKKIFTIKKTVPGSVLFSLSPLSNTMIKKEVYLTDRMPQQKLPLDWALGIFLNTSLYEMYKEGYFTFDDNKALVEAAKENSVFFDEDLDFEPAKSTEPQDILKILVSGDRMAIANAVQKYGSDKVRDVAVSNVESLSTGVVKLLEKMLNVQLIVDGE